MPRVVRRLGGDHDRATKQVTQKTITKAIVRPDSIDNFRKFVSNFEFNVLIYKEFIPL